jgi:hypothetical protein
MVVRSRSAPRRRPTASALPTHQITAPCLFKNQMSSHVNIYRALADHAGKPVFVLGYFEQSMVGNRPFNLTEIKADDPRYALAEGGRRTMAAVRRAATPAAQLLLSGACRSAAVRACRSAAVRACRSAAVRAGRSASRRGRGGRRQPATSARDDTGVLGDAERASASDTPAAGRTASAGHPAQHLLIR